MFLLFSQSCRFSTINEINNAWLPRDSACHWNRTAYSLPLLAQWGQKWKKVQKIIAAGPIKLHGFSINIERRESQIDVILLLLPKQLSSGCIIALKNYVAKQISRKLYPLEWARIIFVTGAEIFLHFLNLSRPTVTFSVSSLGDPLEMHTFSLSLYVM